MATRAPQTVATFDGRIAVNPRGFGFVTVDPAPREGAGPTALFVTPPELNAYLADDLVRASAVEGDDGRFTATSLALLERVRTELFGEVVTRRDALWVRVDREVANTDWQLDAAGLALSPGDFVVARVVDTGHAVALRRVERGSQDFALERVIARHGLRTGFSPEVVAAAVEAAKAPHALGHRRDLRDVPTVTIDAPSTRDIDDAISVMPAGPDGALRLLVSIADVAEFVREGTVLDADARDRATSTYLAGRVLPMLPEELSSRWLSLLPGEDRSCLTAELRIDPEGRVVATDVYESVIRSWARLNYDEVARCLDGGEVSSAIEPVREAMRWFRTAASRIALSRVRRGGVEIAREETKIVLDALTGEAQEVENAQPTSAHALIERFMVAANEAIAWWLHDRGVPAPYRVHDQPDAESVAQLSAFAHNFGFEAGFGRTLTPLALAAFDAQITGAPSEPALRSVLLRSLGPARYTASPLAHFGLAAPLYLHFTSPIRRYADLATHRAIKQYLRGRRDFVADDPAVEALAQHINRRARAAARAETDRRRTLLAAWMTSRIGQDFSARITRVRHFGLIAQIDTTLVEGTIPLESLPGPGAWEPDARETAMVSGERSLAIGVAVRVKVVATDPALGRITFELVSPPA